jgi:hypothetical protein
MNYGDSFRTTREPSIRYIAEVMLEAMTELGIEQFHTFGHHTGVSIQTEMAVCAPKRVLSLIMNGPTFALPEERDYNMKTLAMPNPISVKGTQFMWAWSRTKDNYPCRMVSTIPSRQRSCTVIRSTRSELAKIGTGGTRRSSITTSSRL